MTFMKARTKVRGNKSAASYTARRTRERHEAERKDETIFIPPVKRALLAVLAGGRIVFLVEGFLRARTVEVARRRRLIAGRRLGQRFPRRLLLEFRGFRLVTLEHAHEAAGVAEVGGHQRIAAGIARLQGVRALCVLGRRRRLLTRGIELARAQHAGGVAAHYVGGARVLLVLLALGDFRP